MNNQVEYKNIEIKSYDEIEGIFTGYGAYYNNIDKVNDIILPNAFDRSIQEYKSGSRKIQFNYEHKSDVVLNDNFSNIENQPEGLLSVAQVSAEAKQKYSKEFKNMIELSKQGKGAMSVEFVVRKSINQSGIRIIQEADLLAIAFTKNPANPKAEVKEVKSLDANFDIKNAIKKLNNIDFAKAMFRKYKKNMSRNEGDDLIDKIYELGMTKNNPMMIEEKKSVIKESEPEIIFDINKIKENISKI